MKHTGEITDIISGHRIGINLYKRENVLIFTGPKIASSFLKRYYENVDSKRKTPLYGELVDVHRLSFDVSLEKDKDDKLEWKLWDAGLEYNNNVDFRTSTSKAFYHFVKTKELNSDVMILIRHPYIRFCSAFIQDYIKPLFGMRIFPVFIKSILNTGDKLDNIDEVYETVYHILSRFDSDNFVTEKDFENMPKKLETTKHHMGLFLSRLLKNTYSNTEIRFHEGHNTVYHTLMVHLLISGSVAKHRKIKIVDIEEDNLEDELNFYEVGFQKTNESLPNSHPFLTSMVIYTINNHERYNISDIFDNIKYEINQELFSYKTLKTFKK